MAPLSHVGRKDRITADNVSGKFQPAVSLKSLVLPVLGFERARRYALELGCYS